METYRLIIDDTRLQRHAADTNRDKNLINFTNGVWNIQEQRLIPHDSKYLQTVQIPHEAKNLGIPWNNTLLCDFLANKSKLKDDEVQMVLDYMAYCLTMDYGLKTFLILQGQSNTGKSVLIRFLERMVGYENSSSLSMHELNMRFYPSQLYGKLLNSCADNSSLPLSSIENLKKITGGDMIMHEKKGKDPFFFVPFAKLIFSFNQMPLQLEEKSNAFYKRMRILPMTLELDLDDNYVSQLHSDESIREVIPHLLKRLPLLEIPTTPSSDKLVDGLRQDSDSIHAFISNCCRVGVKSSYTPKKIMYDRYIQYCLDTGRQAHKPHGFIRHLRAQGFKEARHTDTREAVWRGISLRRADRL